MPAELSGIEILETIRVGPTFRECRARQLPLGRTVRVLALPEGILPSSPWAHGLRRKAELLSRLDHPAIARLLDLKEDQTHLALVLEDALDQDLTNLFDRSLAIPACISIGLTLAQALRHAHERGIVHGCLSPEVVRFDREGRIRLEGFEGGFGHEEVEPLEPDGRAGLSPETTIGQKPTTASDLFGLGAILYQALTGTQPFGDPKDPGFPARVRNTSPPPLLRLRPDTPLALRELVLSCLAKVPAERPADAAHLVTVLEALPGPRPERELLRALGERQLIHLELPDVEPAAWATKSERRFGVREALFVGAACGALAVLAISQLRARNVPLAAHADLSLETLQNPRAVSLRVLATPWAHVIVDGIHRDTTPFADPIRLSPGKHVVRLEHPSAPAEERVIEGETGQALLLDVRMNVTRPPTDVVEQNAKEDDTP